MKFIIWLHKVMLLFPLKNQNILLILMHLAHYVLLEAIRILGLQKKLDFIKLLLQNYMV